MKKLINFLGLMMLLVTTSMFMSCKPEVVVEPISLDNFVIPSGEIQEDGVIVIDGSKLKENANEFIYYDLKDYVGKKIEIDFSCKMKTSSSSNIYLMWQVLDSINEQYPIIASSNVNTDWVSVEGSKTVVVQDTEDFFFYLSTHKIDYSKLTIWLKDVELKITVPTKQQKPEDEWMVVPSLKETYKNIFDSFGIACEYGNFGTGWGTPGELYYDNVQKGLKKHADSITLGNELKPQFMFNWWSGAGNLSTTSFKASNGLIIKVPETLDGFSRLNDILTILKKNGLRMRGHVLTWHSQTPDDFFAQNYKAEYSGDLISNLVSKEEMTARHEWYIKTILDYVNDWESKNGYGEGNHIIWAWDVVNEAVADDATTTDYVRGSTSGTKDKKIDDGGSRWYQLYESDEFIVNAFRFANAYAPSDVPLAYNDYNEYMDWKTTGILNLLDSIKNGEAKTINGKSVKPRIDVMGMQSHVGESWPGVSGYETALKKYLEAGLDVHVTEFDVAAKSTNNAKNAYAEYFKMLKKYGKNYSGKNKITSVTIWGINNENSWISNNGTQYPLLFTKVGNEYYANDSFYAVIDAVK